MTAIRRSRRLGGLAVEAMLMLAVLASVVNIVHEFNRLGYLVAPFGTDVSDTWMDWFNVSYWVRPGAFTIWRAVYPPLSFVFLEMFRLPACYQSDPFYARDCDWLGTTALLASYVAAALTAAAAFWKNDRLTAPIRSLAFAFGLPMLFALERGNLILVCLVFFIIANADLIRSRWWRWTSAAITINFKPYLVLPVFALVVRRDWRGFEMIGLLSVFILMVTWAALGQGSPLEIYGNLAAWKINSNDSIWGPIFYTTTYSPILNAQLLHAPLFHFLPSHLVEGMFRGVPILIRTSQLVTLFALAGTWLHPGAVTPQRITSLLLAVGLVSQSWGGYTQALLLFLVFLEPFERPGPVVAILASYLLSISAEYTVSSFGNEQGSSWLAGRTVQHEAGIGLGQLVRPGFIALILWALAFDTINLTLRAHRRGPPLFGWRHPAAPPTAP